MTGDIWARMESAYTEITAAIRDTLTQMMRQSIEKGVVTFKLEISLDEKTVVDAGAAHTTGPNGELRVPMREAIVPEMRYDVTCSLTQKAKTKGFIDCSGEEVYIDEHRGPMMRKIGTPQTSMFDEYEEEE